jgi:hypothetical protein
LKLTQDKETLLRPLQLSQSYYIESNLGSTSIVQRVQKILEKCETDDDLTIRLKDNELNLFDQIDKNSSEQN